MKKLLVCLLVLGLCLVGFKDCFSPDPWEEDKTRDTFFGEAYLAERGIADFPVPKIENSYFDDEKAVLYLNLTREEYDAYVRTVVDYLRQKEEFKTKGYHCSNGVFGLLLIPLTIYQLAPLDDEYIPYEKDAVLFGFSTEETEKGVKQADIKKPRFVSLEWKPTTPKNSAFSYTVEMKFPDYPHAEYLICYNGHQYDKEIVYPVAGKGLFVSLRTCTNCGYKLWSNYYGNGDINARTVAVREGQEFLVTEPYRTEYTGDVVEIQTIIPESGDFKVTANGTEIPKVKVDDGSWTYAFIMPYENVDVIIEAVEAATPQE